jgi:hypothetical protein
MTTPVESSPMFVLCRKLKSLKHPLKSLNKLHFSHISERVARMEIDLEHQQCLLHDSRDDVSLLNMVNQLKSSLLISNLLRKLSSLKSSSTTFSRIVIEVPVFFML